MQCGSSKLCIIWTIVISILLLGATAHTEGQDREPSRISILKISSQALKDNLLGDSTEQEIIVCLPPSYHASQNAYPVVYFLHGYSGNPADILPAWTNFFEPMMKSGSIQEMIFVAPNGKNSRFGSFFVNSPVAGNWEDFIVDEVVSYVDSHYRTVAKAESRGIAGFSMGGFGAINIGLRHPDVFKVVYAASPGLFDSEGLVKAFGSGWNQIFKLAYGAAFSPDPNSELLCRIPEFTGTQADQEIIDNWESGYGRLEEKITAYKQLGNRLKAIRIEFGTNDFYRWIPQGSVYFSELLLAHGIPHETNCYLGGHSLGRVQVQDGMAPFFSKYLKTE